MERGEGTSPSELLKVLRFHFPWQPGGLFFSFLLQGVRVCWVWDEERRGSCSLAWLRQPGDRVWVRKSILDSDWPFTYDRQKQDPSSGGLHNFRETETVTLLCGDWSDVSSRCEKRLSLLAELFLCSFLNKLMFVEQHLILRLINMSGFFVFVCLSAQFKRGPDRVVNCAGQWIVPSSV